MKSNIFYYSSSLIIALLAGGLLYGYFSGIYTITITLALPKKSDEEHSFLQPITLYYPRGDEVIRETTVTYEKLTPPHIVFRWYEELCNHTPFLNPLKPPQTLYDNDRSICIIRWHKSPIQQESSLAYKIVLIESLQKTLKGNNQHIKKIYWHDQIGPLADLHIDFSQPILNESPIQQKLSIDFQKKLIKQIIITTGTSRQNLGRIIGESYEHHINRKIAYTLTTILKKRLPKIVIENWTELYESLDETERLSLINQQSNSCIIIISSVIAQKNRFVINSSPIAESLLTANNNKIVYLPLSEAHTVSAAHSAELVTMLVNALLNQKKSAFSIQKTLLHQLYGIKNPAIFIECELEKEDLFLEAATSLASSISGILQE